MRKTLLALAAVASLAPQFAAAQDTGNWIVRARAVSLQSSNTNSADLSATLSAVMEVATPVIVRTPLGISSI